MNDQNQNNEKEELSWNFDWEKNADHSDNQPLSIDEIREVMAEIRY